MRDGDSVLVLGYPAQEVRDAVAAAKDDPTLLGIEAELNREAQRRQNKTPSSVLSGEFTFQKYRVLSHGELPAFPAPSRALQLLHRLAADPGIVHIMRENK
jgi:hypothetical protein